MLESSVETADTSAREDVKPCPTFLQPNISNPFTCNLCGRTFTGIQYLRKHEKIHTKGTIFTCSVCSYAFSNLYLLSAHERETHGIFHAPKRRGCPPGPRKRTLEMQAELQAQVIPPFVNSQQSQIRVSSFAKSFEPPTSFDKPFKCPLCVRTFRNEQALALHEGVHNDGRLFPCNICDRVFTYLHALKNHERIHSNVKPVPCSFCGKLFTMESRRKLHERKHRIDLKNQKSIINTIPDVRSGEEVDRPYVCRYCSKAFRLKHTLVVHTRIHTGEKPFACPLCDYRSSQKISLDCHMRKHEKNWMQAVNY
jgi:KRAB domain-containing zinc finger protein